MIWVGDFREEGLERKESRSAWQMVSKGYILAVEAGQERARRECWSDTGRPLVPGPVVAAGGQSCSPAVGGGGVTREEAKAAGTPRHPNTISPKTMVRPKEGKVLEEEPAPTDGSVRP